MKLHLRITCLVTATMLILPASAAVIIQSDDFNSRVVSGSISASAAQEAAFGWRDVSSLYRANAGTVNGNARVDQAGSSRSPGGDTSVAVDEDIAARLRSSTGAMTLDNAMQLASLGATSVTITFDVGYNDPDAYTMDLQYSADAAFTTPITLATYQNGATSGWTTDVSVTITDGVGGINFTDDAYFMFRRADVGDGSANGHFIELDNIVISADGPGLVPEPSATLLGVFGSLLLLRRRR